MRKIYTFIIALFFLGFTGLAQDLMSPQTTEKKETVLSNKENATNVGLTLTDFGKVFFKSLKTGNVELLYTISYSAEGLRSTVNSRTTNPEVRQNILQEIKSDFDARIKSEANRRFTALRDQYYSNTQIDWGFIEYVDFNYESDERATERSGIPMGSGYLIIRYEGDDYSIYVDKMAQFLDGWRGNEFGTSAQPMY